MKINRSTRISFGFSCKRFCSFFIAWLFLLSDISAQDTFSNATYRVSAKKNGAIQVVHLASGVSTIFKPDFYVLHRQSDPKLHVSLVKALRYWVPAWNNTKREEVTDYFQSSEMLKVHASKTNVGADKITWRFERQKHFELEAHVELPEDGNFPLIQFFFKALQEGWYSIGYAGAPVAEVDQVEAIWQPLIWQEKRFPERSFLSAEFACTLPATFVTDTRQTYSVVADPSEIPFRFSNYSNSTFGVTLRNPEGKAQPMLFAPVMGQQSSHMKAGDVFTFKMRLYTGPGGCYDAYKTIARDLFAFRDYRRNISGSLNETIENMITYAMNDVYAGWNADLKSSDYATDVKNTVKTVSSLHPLSIAIVTDNEQIYKRRALPTIEYLMSREKYLFTSSEPVDTHQSPSHLLNGPAAEISELAALQLISRRNNPVFEHYAVNLWDKPRKLNLQLVSKGGSWQNALAMYRLSGEQQYLTKARKGADEYIAERIELAQEDFSDVHIDKGGQFWTDFTPKWIDLLELYETSQDKKYLAAAEKSARLFAVYVWMQPTFDDKEITVNPGNKAPMHAHQNRLFENSKPMTAPEQVIEAWTVAPTGLTGEASATYMANRAIFLAHYAAYMLRLYHYTEDLFYRDIARSAIVGRYMNYPGYTISEFSNIFMREDFPNRSLQEATYNTFYYNHIWPNITLLMDYLVTDAIVRSENNIHFPDRYAQGYAYLQSKVYGDRPGTFYGDKDVQLWLPNGLLTADNIQVNYVTGYGNRNLYLAFLNQSETSGDVSVRIDPSLVPYAPNSAYSVDLWVDNRPAGTTIMTNGMVSVPVTSKGITALRIRGIEIIPQFQQKLYREEQTSGTETFSEADTKTGKVTGMILSMGPSLKSLYVWLQATGKELKQVTFYYKIGEVWREKTDDAYPYELNLFLQEEDTQVEYRIEAVNHQNEKIETEAVILKRK